MKLEERERVKFRVLKVKILPSFQTFHLRERCCQLLIFVDRLIVCLSLKMTSKRNVKYVNFDQYYVLGKGKTNYQILD